MSWLPDDFFIGHPNGPESRPLRPLGQGDVFRDVPVAVKTAIRAQGAAAKAKLETAIVVSSSCGMRKAADGALNPTLHVAPVKRLSSLAPGWSAPWNGYLAVLPLLGLEEDEPLAADLARIGLASTDYLTVDQRLACVSQPGMRALKARIATYFVREHVPPAILDVGAHKEWNELDLWETWIERTGGAEGFQPWLDMENPDYPGQSRRDTIYDDFGAIREQLEEDTFSD